MLCVFIVLNAVFIYLYFTRRGMGVKSWYDEPMVWSLLASGSAYFIATMILGEIVIWESIHESYGALGLTYYFLAGGFACYFGLEVLLFLNGQVFTRLEKGKMKEDDLSGGESEQKQDNTF